MHEWLEDDFEPVTPEEQARSFREAILKAREEGWIPKQDPGCPCLVCSQFRPFLREVTGE